VHAPHEPSKNLDFIFSPGIDSEPKVVSLTTRRNPFVFHSGSQQFFLVGVISISRGPPVSRYPFVLTAKSSGIHTAGSSTSNQLPKAYAKVSQLHRSFASTRLSNIRSPSSPHVSHYSRMRLDPGNSLYSTRNPLRSFVASPWSRSHHRHPLPRGLSIHVGSKVAHAKNLGFVPLCGKKLPRPYRLLYVAFRYKKILRPLAYCDFFNISHLHLLRLPYLHNHRHQRTPV
jgi:hypothetical protein